MSLLVYFVFHVCSQNRRPQRQKLRVSGTGNLTLVNVIIVVGRTVAVVVTVVEATVGVMTVALWW